VTVHAHGLSLGLLLRDYRRWAGVTQLELAESSAVSVRTIRDLEHGHATRPRRETIDLIARGLNLSEEHRSRLHLAAGHRSPAARLGTALRGLPVLPPDQGQPVFGRGEEIKRLVEALASGDERLVTLTGIGGVGKTCLAASIARVLGLEHGIAVLWVPLDGAGAQSPDEESAGHPRDPLAEWARETLTGGSLDPVRELVPVIGRDSLLLVLDGAQDSPVSPALLAALLARCPGLRVLVTTRRAHPPTVGLHELLRPLTPPGEEGLPETNAAVQLLAWQVRRVNPAFELSPASCEAIVEICRALDGLPRALEAAASWFLLCSSRRVAELARDTPHVLMAPPSKQRSNTWCLHVLSAALAPLQARRLRLLEALAARRGPWTLDDAVGCGGEDAARVAEDVCALLLHGLVRPAGSGGGDRPLFAVLNLLRRSPLLTGALQAA